MNNKQLAYLVAFGAFILFVVYIVVPWTVDRKNDLVYGMPRTHTIAFDLNPSDDNNALSYFTAQNIEGRVIIRGTLPEPSNTIELKGLYLSGDYARKVPVILSAKLYNDDPYTDLIVDVDGAITVYIAQDGTFVKLDN